MNSRIKNLIYQLLEKVVERLGNLLNKPKSENSKPGSKKTISNEELLNMVRNHPCFTELSMWKVTKANSLNIADPSKKEMVKAYISIICDTCESNTLAFQKMPLIQITELFEGAALPITIANIFKEVNRQAAAAAIPTIFLEKINEVISSYMGAMTDAITDLQLYHHNQMSNVDNVIATLDILYATIHLIGEEVPHIVNSMNGELKMALIGSRYDRG